MHVAYNASTNRQTGDAADANGNLGSNYIYDIENRLLQPGSGPKYAYDPSNKRVWRGSTSPALDEISFWSVDGKKLATYQVAVSGSTINFTLTGTDVYFGGRLIAKGTFNGSGSNDKITLASVKSDKLGSIGKFYPYGQERPSATTNDTEKFTGYYRDAATGLDYADQRYEQPGVGRFMTADPYKASGGPADPGSWNRYAYTRGDPINRTDANGTCDSGDDSCFSVTGTASPDFGSSPGLVGPGIFNPDIENQVDRRLQARLHAKDVKRTTARVSSAIGAALQALKNQDCAALFGLVPGSPDPLTLLTDLQSGESGYGYIQLDDLPLPTDHPNQINNAVTTPTFAYGPAPGGGVVNLGFNGAIITINLDPSTPFNSNASAADRAVTLLHELGHVYTYIWGASASKIVDDSQSSDLSKQNTALVKQNCFK